MAANQFNIRSLGFTNLNNFSTTSKLIAYAATMVTVPESQWPLPATTSAAALRGSTIATGTHNKASDGYGPSC